MDLSLRGRSWWDYVEDDIRELLTEAQMLITKVEEWKEKFHDYAFVVFPAAKAYEGFLKKLFFDRGFITQEDYLGKRFRIGKALNPSLEKELRGRESVYDKIVDFCQGKELADTLWETWKMSRNLLFHWFPKEKNAIDFTEAKERVLMILTAMDAAFKECKIDK
jgi:polyphosphate kinase 2 (PPK2 family)